MTLRKEIEEWIEKNVKQDEYEIMTKMVNGLINEVRSKRKIDNFVLNLPEWFVQELVKDCLNVMSVTKPFKYMGVNLTASNKIGFDTVVLYYEEKIIDKLYIKNGYYDGYKVEKYSMKIGFDFVFELRDLVFRKHG